MNESIFIIDTNVAILADKVGSGKTYMIIGLISNKKVPELHDRFIMGTNHFSIKMISSLETTPVNLIVTPHNLTNQWDEFMATSKLKYIKLNTENDFHIFYDMTYITIDEYHDMVKDVPIIDTFYIKSKKKKIDNDNSDEEEITGDIYVKYVLNIDKIKEILQNTDVFILNVNRYRFFSRIFKPVYYF